MHLSIDPDTKGGAAFFSGSVLVSYVSFKGNPVWEDHLLWRIRTYQPTHCILESATARPFQNSKSTFTHGGVYSSIKTILKIENVAVKYVTPQQWQLKAGVYGLNRHIVDARKRRKANKELFKRKALELYPELPTDAEGLYDAVLIGME